MRASVTFSCVFRSMSVPDEEERGLVVGVEDLAAADDLVEVAVGHLAHRSRPATSGSFFLQLGLDRSSAETSARAGSASASATAAAAATQEFHSSWRIRLSGGAASRALSHCTARQRVACAQGWLSTSPRPEIAQRRRPRACRRRTAGRGRRSRTASRSRLRAAPGRSGAARAGRPGARAGSAAASAAGEHARILETEVHALPGERMHGVGRVADQRHPGRHRPRHADQAQRKARQRRDPGAGRPARAPAGVAHAAFAARPRRARPARRRRSSGADQTIEIRRPGSGSQASTPSLRNHWRATSPCGASVSKFATSAVSP